LDVRVLLYLWGGTPRGMSPTEQTIVVEEHGGVEARRGSCER
jgi:hypothetical protein